MILTFLLSLTLSCTKTKEVQMICRWQSFIHGEIFGATSVILYRICPPPGWKRVKVSENFCANVSPLWLHPRVVSIYYKKEKKTEDISTWSTKIFHLSRTRLIVSNSISLCMFPCSKYQWIETTYIPFELP